MARRIPRGIKQPHPLGSVASRSGISPLTVLDGGVTTSTGVKISELIAASAANSTDQLEVNQAGTSRRITVDQLLDVTGGGYLALTGGTLAGPGNLAVGGTLGVTGATTLSAALTGTTATFATSTSAGALTATTGNLSGALTGTTATFSGGVVNITGTTNPNFVVYNSTVGGFGLFAETGTSGQMVIYRATTAGAWAENYAVLNATSATFSKPVIAPGAQIQMVSTQTGAVATGTTVIPFDDTIPQITEGNEYMTLAITPKSATSRLIIEVILVGSNTAISSIIVALFQDSTANALAATTQTIAGSNQVAAVPLRHTMTSGSTGSTTFRVRAGASAAGTTTFNGNASTRVFGGVMASSIVIREVAT